MSEGADSSAAGNASVKGGFAGPLPPALESIGYAGQHPFRVSFMEG